jgi:hypothetical protein
MGEPAAVGSPIEDAGGLARLEAGLGLLAVEQRGGGFAMPQTGGTCQQSGIYANDCHSKQIALSKGETFPPCSGCHRAADWHLIRPTR